MYLMTQSKTNIAAPDMKRQLGISWKSAWLLKHKLMKVMRQREAARPLAGDVRVDDACLGGERPGGGPGRGSSSKVPFVAAVEMREGRPQRVRFDLVTGVTFAAPTVWAQSALAPGCGIVSDGLLGFEVLGRISYTHKTVPAPKGKAGSEIEPFKWLNVLPGNLKNALSGTHHYLAEVGYRFNRRFDLAAMVPRLAVAATQTPPCSKRKIIDHFEVST
jgi:hypothetical protein